MLKKISEITSGWKNHLFPPEQLKEAIQEVSEYRLSICIGCDRNSTPNKIKLFSRCKECGCPLIQKSKSLQSKCPIDKWSAVTSKELEAEIKNHLNGETNSSEGSTVETSNRN